MAAADLSRHRAPLERSAQGDSFQGPDWLTGGPLGPEASLLIFPVIALMFLVFERIYRPGLQR